MASFVDLPMRCLQSRNTTIAGVVPSGTPESCQQCGSNIRGSEYAAAVWTEDRTKNQVTMTLEGDP